MKTTQKEKGRGPRKENAVKQESWLTKKRMVLMRPKRSHQTKSWEIPSTGLAVPVVR